MEIVIERFKNLEKVEMSINGICLLVGGNNSGKSSVLQAIQFGVAAAQTSKLQGGTWKKEPGAKKGKKIDLTPKNRLSTSIGQGDLVYSPIKDVMSLARNGRLREQASKAISITYKDNGLESQVTVRRGKNKNIQLELTGRKLGEQLQSIESPYSALVTGLAGIRSEEGFETSIVVRKAAAKGDSNSVFRNILLQLTGYADKWKRFQDQIGRIFPGYSVDVAFDPKVDETINCTVKKSGSVYPIDSCGTGVLQVIQIFSYVNLFEPKLLLLDEPDSHLHPNNQKQLARELIEYSQGGPNIIVSTHSKHLVEALIESSDLVWLRNGVKQAPMENYELKALLEIGALNAGERISTPTYVILTEDEDQGLLKKLLKASGYDLDECEIKSYKGCTQVNSAIALLSHLMSTWPKAKFAIHRDRDFLDDKVLDDYKSRFEKMGIEVFIPNGNDLESHFCTPAHISESCGVTEEMAMEIVQAAFTDRKNELHKRYVNQVIENTKKAGEPVDAGEISVQCNNLLTGPHSTAVHGKILMKGLRNELKKRGVSDRLMSISSALTAERLSNLWQRIK